VDQRCPFNRGRETPLTAYEVSGGLGLKVPWFGSANLHSRTDLGHVVPPLSRLYVARLGYMALIISAVRGHRAAKNRS
jgi:hypothetical protein